jgi:hypothetical protein
VLCSGLEESIFGQFLVELSEFGHGGLVVIAIREKGQTLDVDESSTELQELRQVLTTEIGHPAYTVEVLACNGSNGNSCNLELPVLNELEQ